MEYMFLRILTTDTNACGNISIPGESTLSGHATDIGELLSATAVRGIQPGSVGRQQ